MRKLKLFAKTWPYIKEERLFVVFKLKNSNRNLDTNLKLKVIFRFRFPLHFLSDWAGARAAIIRLSWLPPGHISQLSAHFPSFLQLLPAFTSHFLQLCLPGPVSSHGEALRKEDIETLIINVKVGELYVELVHLGYSW